MKGKRIQFDDETWAAIDLLSRDSMRSFEELAEEAFRDLLAKHGRPTGLTSQLKQSQTFQDSEIARTKRKIAATPIPSKQSPSKGMALLRRGRLEVKLKALRGRKGGRGSGE